MNSTSLDDYFVRFSETIQQDGDVDDMTDQAPILSPSVQRIVEGVSEDNDELGRQEGDDMVLNQILLGPTFMSILWKPIRSLSVIGIG